MTAIAAPLKALSSMATKALLEELRQHFVASTAIPVELESVGGVEAARRVAQGEAVDVVLLAREAIERLMASGHVLPETRCDWVRSLVAMAVPAGSPPLVIEDAASLKVAVQNAPSIGYSTGPSGVYLEQLFQRWGLTECVKAKLVVPPAGTPVGQLIARGQVALGFQQRSELMALPGIVVLGDLPPEVAYTTTFSSALGSHLANDVTRRQAARQWQAHLMSQATTPIKLRHGMQA